MGTEVEVQGDIETQSLADKYEDLLSKVQQLQQAIFERQSNLELDIRLAKKRTEGEMEDLRAQYDRHIDRGDKKAADQVLDQIAAARKELVTLAKNIEGTSSDFSDLEAREDEPRQEANKMCLAATKNHLDARMIDQKFSGLSGTLSSSVPRDIRKLTHTIDEAKKVAEQILSE